MATDEIVIPLQVKEDKHGSKYLLGFPRLKANLDLSEFALFIFYSEEGAETLVIRPKIQKDTSYQNRDSQNREPEIFRRKTNQDE